MNNLSTGALVGAILGTVSGLSLAYAAAGRQPMPQKSGDQAHPSLAIGVDKVTPGKTFDLGVRFTLDKDWHLYWPGQNDSGLPPTVSLKLPPGWKAGAVRWPAPERLVYDHEFVAHVYFNEVTLVLPVEIPSDEPPGRREIAAELTWMVCHDLCEIGSATLNLPVEVGTPGQSPRATPEAKRIAGAVASAPMPWPKDGSLIARLEPGRLTIHGAKGVALAFLPHADSVLVESVLDDCVGKPGAPLEIRLKKPNPDQTRVAGIVRVTDPSAKDRQAKDYWLELPLHPAPVSSGTK